MATSPATESATCARVRWAGALRVSAFLGVLGFGLCYWSVRAAYAEAEQKVWKLGQQLAADLGPSIIGAPQGVSINGQPLFVASRQSDLSVSEVLDRFASECAGRERRDAPAAPPELLQPARALARRPAAARSLLEDPARFGVMRAESDAGGQLACLAQREPRRGLAELVDGARDFLASGDLSRLGDLRYVAVRKLPTGRTHVLSVWSEGPFRIGALFPEQGDAPGSDLPQVARPPESTRALCALAPGRGFGLRLYDSRRPAREVLAFYDRELPQAGWQPLPLMLERGELRAGVFARAFTRDGHAIALSVEVARPDGEGSAADGELSGAAGGSAISLVDLGSVHHVAAFAGAAPVD